MSQINLFVGYSISFIATNNGPKKETWTKQGVTQDSGDKKQDLEEIQRDKNDGQMATACLISRPGVTVLFP